MKRLCVLLGIMLLFAAGQAAAEEAVPELKLIYQSVSGSEEDFSTDLLVLEFNLRIDRVGISVLFNGNTAGIEEISLKNGKRLEIRLKEPITDESQYTLSVSGIKDIYISQPYALFFARVKNTSRSPAEFKFVLTERERLSRKISDVKIISQSVEAGKTEEVFLEIEGFDNACELCGFGFSDLGKLIPVS